LFKAVIITALAIENMNHHIPVVHEDPNRISGFAFNMVRPDSNFPQPARNVLGNGLHLGLALTVTNHENIR